MRLWYRGHELHARQLLAFGCFQYDTLQSFLWLAGRPLAQVVRLRLEAVGSEWDGTIKPLDELSGGTPHAS